MEKFIKKTPSAYYRFTSIKSTGERYLRYAVADSMRDSCVNCHINHPDSPKTGWKEGDFKGVLEVNIPLDDIIKKSDDDLFITIVIYIVISLLGVFGVILLIFKHKDEARTLEEAIVFRTKKLATKK
jgi:adenylate cyclase